MKPLFPHLNLCIPVSQVVHRPRNRPARSPILKFKLLTLREPSPEEKAAAAAAEEAAAAAAAGAKVGKGKAAAASPAPPATPPPAVLGLYEQGRWVIPAHGTVELAVQFQSDTLGKFTDTMAFEVVGGERSNPVTMTGTCGLPTIATDYRCGGGGDQAGRGWPLDVI